MVRKLALLALVGMVGTSTATETGSLAYRAHKLYEAGVYSGAMQLFNKALEASAKEADQVGENHVIIDIAHLQLEAYHFADAESSLVSLHTSILNVNDQGVVLKTRMELCLFQDKYTEAAQIFRNAEKLVDSLSDELRGLIFLDAAIAAAGNQDANANALLKKGSDLLEGDAPGLVFWTQARIADLQHQHSADSLYLQSLDKAQKGQHSWIAGQILLHLGKLSQAAGDKEAAAEYDLRAAKLYRGLSLDQPFILAAEAYLALTTAPERAIVADLSAAKERLVAPVRPESVKAP